MCPQGNGVRQAWPRPLTPIVWLQLAWGRRRREVVETRAFWLPTGLCCYLNSTDQRGLVELPCWPEGETKMRKTRGPRPC